MCAVPSEIQEQVAATKPSRVYRLNRYVWKLRLLSAQKKMMVAGMPVYAIAKEDSLAPLQLAKIRRALKLVHRSDPIRYQRVIRALDRVVVTYEAGTHFYAALGMAVVKWQFIASASDARVALSLIHEATHARIDRCGIKYLPGQRHRIESACIRQEALFARHIPHLESDIARSRSAALDNPWWTPEKQSDRRLGDMRDIGYPAWMIRLIAWMTRRRLAAQRKQEARISTDDSTSDSLR
jgi:hypothetical protein